MKHIQTFVDFINESEYEDIVNEALELLNEETVNEDTINERDYDPKEIPKPNEFRTNPKQDTDIEYLFTYTGKDTEGHKYSDGEVVGARKNGQKYWTTANSRLQNAGGAGGSAAKYIVSVLGKVYPLFQKEHPNKNTKDCVNSMVSSALTAIKKKKNPEEAINSLIKRWMPSQK